MSRKRSKTFRIVDFASDEFDTSVKVCEDDIVCALCKCGKAEGEKLKKILGTSEIDDVERLDCIDMNIDPEGVWVSKYPLKNQWKQRKFWLHYFCALFSPRAMFIEKKWYNLYKEVQRSSALVCKSCKRNGASVGCYDIRCNFVVHVPCAIQLGWKPSFHKTSNEFYCPAHADQYYEEDENVISFLSTDISKGSENFPITMDRHNSNISPDKMFVYISSNVDSDDLSTGASGLTSLECCDCTGSCNDVRKCACLQVMPRTITIF